jgi:hypothetical protein
MPQFSRLSSPERGDLMASVPNLVRYGIYLTEVLSGVG